MSRASAPGAGSTCSTPALFPIGSAVQYLSRSRGQWVPARVIGLRPEQGLYELDVQPMAAFQHVRAVPLGTRVEYSSSSQGRWIPALVTGYDAARALYQLDVRADANPAMVRLVAPATAACPALAVESSPTYLRGAEAPPVRERAAGALPSAPPRPAGRASSRGGVGGGGAAEVEAATLCASGPWPASGYAFQCPLCLVEVSLDDGVCLDCDHKLCTTCFAGYCGSKISEGRVLETELVCPALGEGDRPCRQPVTVEQVRGNVEGAVFDRFCSLRAACWRPSEGEGRLVQCPTPGCTSFVVGQQDGAAVACPECGQVLCCRCCLPAHLGETCEERARRLRAAPLSDADRQFEAAVESEGWTRCPRCRAPTVHEQGCYFMQCQSEACRGRVHFCYLCGEELDGSDHAPGRSLGHFPRGPYNMECVNVTEEEYRKAAASRQVAESSFVDAPLTSLVEGARRFLEV